MTASEILSFLWEANVSLACFGFFYLVALRRLTFFQWNRIYLMLAPIASIAIAGAHIEIEQVTVVGGATLLSLSDLFPEFAAVNEPSIGLSETPSVFESLLQNWPFAVSALLVLTAILLYCQAAFQWISLKIHLNRTSVFISTFGVYENDRFHTAFVFENRIYLPSSFLLLPLEDLRSVIAHEQAHLRFNHRLDNMLYALIKPLFWFNPLYWTMQREAKLVHEYQVDRACTEARNSPDYAELLLRLSAPGLTTSLIQPFSKNLIKKRVKKLNQSNSSVMKKALFIVSIALCGTLFYAFSIHQVSRVVYSTMDEHSNQSNFTAPIDLNSVTRFTGFGRRHNPLFVTREMHTGVDFAAPIGTNILAAANGTVTLVESRKDGYGNLIEITHEDHIITRYAHLETLSVKEGASVTQGAVIGTCGNSGKSTGPHLHFEVIADGVAVDPEAYISISDSVLAESSHLKKGDMTIILDPGHGGVDIGVSTAQIEEKALTLEYAQRLKSILENENFNVKLTRNGDEAVALDERAGLSEANALFISLHFNQAESESTNGVEVYVPAEAGERKVQSQKAARAVMRQLQKEALVHRGLKEANFAVLKNTSGPAILIELGFLSSPPERENILSEPYKDKLVTAIAKGIELYAQ